MKNPPHREPGPARARTPKDPVIAHLASGYESANYLQQQAATAVIASQVFGEEEGLFGVSGWIVSGIKLPLPEGYALLSSIRAAGFRVVETPHLGRPGHVTILLQDPVDEDQARQFNAVFGRYEEQ